MESCDLGPALAGIQLGIPDGGLQSRAEVAKSMNNNAFHAVENTVTLPGNPALGGGLAVDC
jgi:hypothetical protein